jgi:hypothetical protein
MITFIPRSVYTKKGGRGTYRRIQEGYYGLSTVPSLPTVLWLRTVQSTDHTNVV